MAQEAMREAYRDPSGEQWKSIKACLEGMNMHYRYIYILFLSANGLQK